MAYDDIFVKDTIARDDTQIIEVMLRSSTTGQGITGKTYEDFTCYYIRQGQATGATAITLASATIGTYTNSGAAGTGGGFVEVDATDAPGVYQFSIPDAVLATGANSVTIHFKATGVIDKAVRLLLVAAGTDLRTVLATPTNITAAAGCAVSSIGNNVITTASINDGAITNAKVADDVDVNVKTITNGAITAAAIATDAIDADAIAADAVTEIQAGLATSAQVAAIGSGVGAALNFEVVDDNSDAPLNSVTAIGTQTGTFANTLADNGVTHQIASALDGGTQKIDWVYKFTCGGGRSATQLAIRANMAAVTDTVTVQVYDFSGTPAWDSMGTITGTTETLYDIPLFSGHTGTGANAGVVYVRFLFDEADAGTLVIDQCYVTAQNLGQTIGYANGSLWVKATGTSGTTPYVNGTGDNPAPWADIKTLNTALGLNRYVVTPGTTITLDAALSNSVMTGRSYSLALGGQNISGSYFEGVESLSGTGTTATAEAIFVDSHIGTVTLGEFDFVRCHIHGTITLNAASKYYRIHDCTGIENAVIEFAAASQTLALSRMSGNITVTGMTTGDTLLVDGDGMLTIGATCDGGTVHISGNVEITNSGSGQTITYGGTKLNDIAHGGSSASLDLGAGATISNASGSAVTLTSNGSNGHGLLAQGHGTGSGITASGGGTSGNGIYAVGDADGMGIMAVGGDSALGLTAGIFAKSNASANPVGMYIEDGTIITDDFGTALMISSTGGNGHGIEAVGNGSGSDISADITGNIAGTVTTVTNLTNAATVGDLTSTMKTSVEDAVWDAATADHTDTGTTGKRIKNIAQTLIWDGTAQAGSTANTIVLDTGASGTDGAYDPACISIIAGTGAGQTRNILQYTGSTRVAVVDRDWKVIPSTDSEFVIVSDAGREHVNEGLARAGGASTIQLNASASDDLNAYVGQIIVIRSGTGQDQARRVLSYDETTKTATVSRPWAHIPDTTSAYVMLPTGALSYECIRGAVGLASANLDTQLADIPTVAEFTARTAPTTGGLGAEFTAAALVNAPSSGLDAAGVRGAIGMASANLDTQLADLPTVAEFTARTAPTTGGLGAEFTAAALVNAPSGSGLDAAGVRAAIGMASANLDSQLDALPTAAENATATRNLIAGSGAASDTITVIDGSSNPVADCEVWITSDEDGTTTVAGPLVTDDDGTVQFFLDAGVTYYCWRRKSGYNFTNPTSFVATGD